MNTKKLKNITYSALLAAFVCAATMIIRIPTPSKGYINLGDCLVNVSAWLLGPVYGAAAAGTGSAFADILSGYIIYAPVTFIIKAVMAVVSYCVYSWLSKKVSSLPSRAVSAVLAELIMILGYAAFEAVIYGSLSVALLGAAGNAVQGAMGAAASVTVYESVIKKLPKQHRL